ncbi:MAG: ATP synthase F1 subunit delta [Nitrospirae bacterium]|nr:ATP synthase F1 subunit delta [Nitrospirota bacterium]
MNKAQAVKKFSKAFISKVSISDAPKALEELGLFSSILDSDKKIRLFFVSQIFTLEEKDAVLKDISARLKLSSHTEKFLSLLFKEGAIAMIKDIIKAAVSLYEEKAKRVTAEVSAPVELEGRNISRLKAALASLIKKDVEIESKIDESLIGGFVVKIGSTIYDSSIKGQLQLLKAELTR